MGISARNSEYETLNTESDSIISIRVFYKLFSMAIDSGSYKWYFEIQSS